MDEAKDIARTISAKEVLGAIRSEAEGVARGRTKPYDGAYEMWGLAMRGVGERSIDGTHCHALWLLWGGIHDWLVREPNERPQAEDAVVRAAQEWLAVADEEPRWRAFFERWLYDELWYARPSAENAGRDIANPS